MSRKSNDRFWNSIVRLLRRTMGFSVPPPTELQAELDAIEAEPLTDSETREIVEAVVKCRLCDHCAELCPYVPARWLTLHGDGCMWHICPRCKIEYAKQGEQAT